MVTSSPLAPPDPGQAAVLDDLVEGLRLLKVWAGDPSFERITDRINSSWSAAGRPAAELARKTTVADCFKTGRRRMNTDLVVAVVQALHPDADYATRWRQALRVIGGETQAASQVRVQDSLPQDLPGFTGRTTELDQLRRGSRMGEAVVISAIAGMAGVGKTRLAVHIGHSLLREKVFDRVLFVNLRGFHPDPAQPPADPGAVLDGFLRLLGMPGRQIPHDLEARVEAYRHRLAGQRTLVVLDNAADGEQVRPLLPATPGCLALVTSRRDLTGLSPAIHVDVDVFTPAESVAFLAKAVPGVEIGTDPRAAARIAERCGHLPLALSLVAGHILATPGWTLTDHADRLDERHAHAVPETGVELALDLSYQHLPTDHQRLLRLAGLHPGQDFDVYAAAALTGFGLTTAEGHLDRLCRDHLLQQGTPGRYSLHDLVRVYATSRAGDEDAPSSRHAALSSLFGYYLATTASAMDTVFPAEARQRPRVAPPATPAPDLSEVSKADLWLETELPNLLATAQHAANHGWPEHIWQLSATLDRHLRIRVRTHDAESLHQQALNLARRLGNRAAEVRALNGLGYMLRMLDRHEQASNHYNSALRIARSIGERGGELQALSGLASADWMLGRYEQTAERYAQALVIAREIGDRFGERNTLTGLGDVQWRLGRYEQAAEHYGQALQIARGIGDRSGERSALSGLGLLHRLLGNYEQAAEHYAEALQIADLLGDRIVQLQGLTGLGYVHLMLGSHTEAASCYKQVLDIARELGSGNWQYEALQGLGRLYQATGNPDLALTHHREALQHATELAQPADEARAHDGLAHAHHAKGQLDQARTHWQQALDILTGLGTEHSEDAETSIPAISAHLAKLA